MSQNRDAPAYMEYAAAMMAKLTYRTMTLQERGLAWTMRNECWVNGTLPGRHDLLAKVLGVTEQQIDDSLPAVMAFFDVSDGYIFCPELEDYKKHLEERKEKLSRSGKAGADITNKKKKDAKNRINSGSTATSSATPSGVSQLPRRGQVGVLVQSSTVKPSQDQSLEKEIINDPWLAEYDSATKQSEVTV